MTHDIWHGYGAPTICPEVVELEEHYPAGYDEDGGQLHLAVTYYSITAGNEAYEWSAAFDIREAAEAELALALADPSRLEAEDSVWGRRTPFGSIAWGPEDEWQMMTDEERARVGSWFWRCW